MELSPDDFAHHRKSSVLVLLSPLQYHHVSLKGNDCTEGVKGKGDRGLGERLNCGDRDM